MTFNWFDIQFFSEGAGAASGGEGEGTTGVQAADAGQQPGTLESLGVPAHLREKWAESKKRRGLSTAANEPRTYQSAASPAPMEGEPKGGEAQNAQGDASHTTQKQSWEEILKDPEYKAKFDAQVSGIVRNRLSGSEKAREELSKLAPALALLTRQYGVKDGDYDALTSAIRGDKNLYKAKAAELGVDLETAQKLEQAEQDAERANADRKNMAEQQALRMHFDNLTRQAEALKVVYPTFDLAAEMRNPEFVKFTSPQTGMSLKQAYFAVHGEQIAAAKSEAGKKEAVQQVANTIRAGQSRPKENGTATPASVKPLLYSQMSKEERAAALKYMKGEAAKGNAVSYINR